MVRFAAVAPMLYTKGGSCGDELGAPHATIRLRMNGSNSHFRSAGNRLIDAVPHQR
jgi:hypothetical protein